MFKIVLEEDVYKEKIKYIIEFNFYIIIFLRKKIIEVVDCFLIINSSLV